MKQTVLVHAINVYERQQVQLH